MKKGSGILLHISSLPSRFGIGDFGPAAYSFVDFLRKSGQRYWQILPLNPPFNLTNPSPYTTYSAFAGHELYISPEQLVRDGWLKKTDLQNAPKFPKEKVLFSITSRFRNKLLRKAVKNFLQNPSADFKSFCKNSEHWLDDYALFMSLKEHYGSVQWSNWPKTIRDRQNTALKKAKEKHAAKIEHRKVLQYFFFTQYKQLQKYCKKQSIQIIGDIPIYVAYDSADVWSHSQYFKLDKRKRPTAISGVPPDYFSKTGQLWRTPVYNWKKLKAKNYDWWIERSAHNLQLFDYVRLDHFRGFAGFWEVPAKAKDARSGKWVKGPGMDVFEVLRSVIGKLHFIVEDLGEITEDVIELADDLGYPRMRVLQFGFGREYPDSPHTPYNHIKNAIVYTGTHDNNTTLGWFKNEIGKRDKQNLEEYLGRKASAKTINETMIRLAMQSPAKVTILPMQDILKLDSEARMNKPATERGNWRWRVTPKQLLPSVACKLCKITKKHNR